MSAFYSQLADVAQNLITQFGRDIQILKESRTSTDPAKPWRGTDDTGDITVTVKGAIVAIDDRQVDGDLVRRGDLDCWIPAVTGQDVSTFDFVVDEGTRMKILNVETVRPGPQTVAYRLRLRV